MCDELGGEVLNMQTAYGILQETAEAKQMKKIVLQGHDRHGWDTERVETMEEAKAYLDYQKRAGTGPVTVYIDDVEVHTFWPNRNIQIPWYEEVDYE